MRKSVGRLGALTAAITLAAACDTGQWVAKAGPYTLTTEEFAEIIHDWKYFPLRETEVEKWAHRWVEWTLFADRIAEGDSLADSATVYYAVWPEVYQLLFQALEEQLLRDSVYTPPAIIDSAYEVGDHRLIYHVLLRPLPGASEAERQRTVGEIRGVRSRLLAGGSFAVENERNRDDWAKVRGGSLGVVIRGQMVPAFDSAIFALEAGEISDIIETESGYHVAWRPELSEAREEFVDGYRDALVTKLDSVLHANLPRHYNLTYTDDGYDLVRAAVREPLTYLDSDDVIATYGGVQFTGRDFIRRLRMEPPDLRARLETDTDGFIRFQLDEFMEQELFVLAAIDAGIALTPDLNDELRFGHKQNMANVTENMQLDRFLDEDASESQRRASVQAAVRDHFLQIASQERVPRYVPTFLSDVLRDDASWRVSDRGVIAVVELVRRLAGTEENSGDRPGRSPG